MSRRLWLPAVLGLAIGASVAVPGPAGVEATPPPSQRVYMVTDSVGLGAAGALPRAFPPGWQVVVEGDAGEFVETLESRLVRPRIASAPWTIGDHAIVAGGYNYPHWDPARFDRSIDSMVRTLTAAGVKHVYWVTLREVKPQYITASGWRQIQPYSWYFPTVNDHLERALERHPNLTLIDWAAVADQPGLTYDAIHLNPTGSALYSQIARAAVDGRRTAVPDGSITRVSIPRPAGVKAVALNLTTTDPRRSGYLTAFACDQPVPTVSNHNFARGQTVAHSAIVPVSATGEVCILAKTSTNLIVDITGRFDDGADISAKRPVRVADTRTLGDRSPQPARTPLVVDLGSQTTPAALTVTAVGATRPGWVRAAPCGSAELTSNLNMNDSTPVPNVVMAQPGADGTVCVTGSVDTHLLVDRFVAFGASSGIRVASPPRRVLDTRRAGAAVAAGGVVVLRGSTLGVTADTTGVMLNLTATGSYAPGFLTAYPCRLGRPNTSNLNYSYGQVIANFAIIEPDDRGDICISAKSTTHVVVDLLGTTSSGFEGGVPVRLRDTRVDNLP